MFLSPFDSRFHIPVGRKVRRQKGSRVYQQYADNIVAVPGAEFHRDIHIIFKGSRNHRGASSVDFQDIHLIIVPDS